MLTGSHAALRAVEDADLETLRAWRNRQELRRYFREHREISSAMQRRWFESVADGDPNTYMFAVVDAGDGRLLGAGGLCWIDWRNRSADFSLYLGTDGLYIDDLYAPDAGRMLLDYGFAELGLNRIWAEIYGHDKAKQHLLPSLGFTLEGRHRETTRAGGRFVDSLFYAILASDWEYEAKRAHAAATTSSV
ncbi:MAG: GNAT family N-acetyltransferase [Caulobacterales bacterium]|nr:GNAT family N-acetyltransferase [Caulobacterales bacterium]